MSAKTKSEILGFTDELGDPLDEEGMSPEMRMAWETLIAGLDQEVESIVQEKTAAQITSAVDTPECFDFSLDDPISVGNSPASRSFSNSAVANSFEGGEDQSRAFRHTNEHAVSLNSPHAPPVSTAHTPPSEFFNPRSDQSGREDRLLKMLALFSTTRGFLLGLVPSYQWCFFLYICHQERVNLKQQVETKTKLFKSGPLSLEQMGEVIELEPDLLKLFIDNFVNGDLEKKAQKYLSDKRKKDVATFKALLKAQKRPVGDDRNKPWEHFVEITDEGKKMFYFLIDHGFHLP